MTLSFSLPSGRSPDILQFIELNRVAVMADAALPRFAILKVGQASA